MREMLRMVVWFLSGLALIVAIGGCSGGQMRPPGEGQPAQEIGAMVDEALSGAQVPEGAKLEAEGEAPVPAQDYFKPELTPVADDPLNLDKFPDNLKPNAVAAVDAKQLYSSPMYAEWMRSAAFTQLMAKFEEKAKFNMEIVQSAYFACAPTADKDCGEKLFMLKADENEKTPPFKAFFDNAAAFDIVKMGVNNIDVYKEKDSDTYFVELAGRLVAGSSGFVKFVIDSGFEQPRVPQGMFMVAEVKAVPKMLEATNFIRADIVDGVKPVQRYVVMGRMAADSTAELAVRTYVGDKAWSATVVKIDPKLIEWEKLLQKFKDDDEDNKVEEKSDVKNYSPEQMNIKPLEK